MWSRCPARGALNTERHLYEKIVFVVEGRGSTEVWQEGQTKRQVFEWQQGLAVHDPAERVPPLRQCDRHAGAAPVRHLGAERA